MANLEGINIKYTVVKNDDVANYLDENQVETLSRLLTKVMAERMFAGKLPENIYLVINTDEPYADQIIDIMKSHGHWG